jgi:protein phosphatase
MLICPQCEFENPESNRFCQSCGGSLTHKVCCQCEASIPIEAEACNVCGATNHTVLWAIISSVKASSQLDPSPELAQVGRDSSSNQPSLEISSLAALFAHSQSKNFPALQIETDTEQTGNRYAIRTEPDSVRMLSNSHGSSTSDFIQSQVIDQYPLQKSHLATLQKQQMDLFAELSQELSDSYLAVTEYWNLIGLPTHALPYLILEKYTPTVPQIYDAWQQQDQGVVLLPDRSQWQLVTELWSQQQLGLSEVVWFLDEMAKLWSPLQRISCAQSLLCQENLRIDEDQAFCLQQLYMDGQETPTLKDLAQTWQFCFAQSNLDHLAQIEQLNLLLDKMISGEIIDVEQLRLELHNLGLEEAEDEFLDLPEPYTVDTTPPEVNMMEINDLESTKSVAAKAIATEAEIFLEETEETDDAMMYATEFEEQTTEMIPMQLRSLTDACCTDIGVQRDHNEDFFGVRTTIEKSENNTENNLKVRGLYLVCDGMGGHAAGEVASEMAVETLQQYFQTKWQSELPDHDTIEAGVLLANQTLYQSNLDNSRSGSGRMGTTLVMALVQDTKMAIAHVGDSRIYRFSRKQGLEQLTSDHEVGQREINRGVEPEIAYGRPDAYQLTQALGPRDNNSVRPEIKFLDIKEDCLILLCSDGFSDHDFIEENCPQHLEPLIKGDANLQDGLFNLVDLANAHNGHDNITAVLLRIKLKPDC